MKDLKTTTAAIIPATSVPSILENDPDYRAFKRFQAATGRRAVKRNEVTKACLKAIGENTHHWLEGQSEEVRVSYFFAIEMGASKTDQRKIAQHPMRPALVSEIVAKAQAEAEAAAETAQARDEAARDDSAA